MATTRTLVVVKYGNLLKNKLYQKVVTVIRDIANGIFARDVAPYPAVCRLFNAASKPHTRISSKTYTEWTPIPDGTQECTPLSSKPSTCHYCKYVFISRLNGCALFLTLPSVRLPSRGYQAWVPLPFPRPQSSTLRLSPGELEMLLLAPRT